ncbi:MAG: TlpA disulfide reductase family protein [Flavobacterium sp.]|nr:TlpA disulfide reductase family protein [Flavobacterium sp.]
MKNNNALIVFILILFGCSESSKHRKPVVEASVISKSMINWLYYERDNMNWSADYLALDERLQPITKENFLKRLITGKYLPLKLVTTDSNLYYQLYPLNNTPNENEIGEVISNKAKIEFQYFKMAGIYLPKFNFIDIDGNIYNKNTVKGKTLIINCWFIHCKSCVAEIPQLNTIVSNESSSKKFIFLGLAFDSTKALRQFLTTKKFEYNVIPGMEDYLINELKISGYPTHIVVDSNGIIIKVIDSKLSELLDVIKKMAS